MYHVSEDRWLGDLMERRHLRDTEDSRKWKGKIKMCIQETGWGQGVGFVCLGIGTADELL